MNRWTTLDRLLSVEPGKGARGLRNIPHTLPIFDTHFPRFPVMPGVLILGSLEELSRLFMREQTGWHWQLTRMEQMRFRHFVQPGDQIELEVHLKTLADETAVLSGAVKVAGRVVTTVRIIEMAAYRGEETV